MYNYALECFKKNSHNYNYNITLVSLPDSLRPAVINGAVYGIAYGFTQSISLITFAIIVRFGAFQVTVSPDHIVHAEYQDIFRVSATLLLTALGMGKVTSFIVRYSKGKESAMRIFGILRRESQTKDCVTSSITLVSIMIENFNEHIILLQIMYVVHVPSTNYQSIANYMYIYCI